MKLNEVVTEFRVYVLSNCNKFPNSLESVIVFGSYARGEARVGSDLDIALVVSNIDHLDYSLLTNLLEDFNHTLEVNFFYTTFNKIESTTDMLDANYHIRKEGLCVWQR